jgi:hypothetical protein
MPKKGDTAREGDYKQNPNVLDLQKSEATVRVSGGTRSSSAMIGAGIRKPEIKNCQKAVQARRKPCFFFSGLMFCFGL